MSIETTGAPPPRPVTYSAQLAERVAELLPGVGLGGRLELLGAMDPAEMSACLAWLTAAHPGIFDHALVRDRKLVERLQARLGRQRGTAQDAQ